MSPNNGILFNGVLIPKLLNNPFADIFINYSTILLHILMIKASLSFLVSTIFESLLLVFSLHSKQYVSLFVL